MSTTTLAEAAKALLAACDTSVYMNDYCGLEVSKHDAAGVNEAIEGLRKALEAAPAVEPVAWVDERAIAWLQGRNPAAHITTPLQAGKSFERPMPLYAAPAAPSIRATGFITV